MAEVECHAVYCDRPATTLVRIGNEFTFKDRPTTGIGYCDEHANERSRQIIDRGMRAFLEPAGREGERGED